MDPKQKEGQDNPVAGGIYSSDASASSGNGSGLFSFRKNPVSRTSRNPRPISIPGSTSESIINPGGQQKRTRTKWIVIGSIIGVLVIIAIIVSIVASNVSNNGSSEDSEDADSEETTLSEEDTEATFYKYLSYLFFGDENNKNYEEIWDKITKDPTSVNDIYAISMLSNQSSDDKAEYFTMLNDIFTPFADSYAGTGNPKDVSTFFYDYAILPNISPDSLATTFEQNGEASAESYIDSLMTTESTNEVIVQYVELEKAMLKATVSFFIAEEENGCQPTGSTCDLFTSGDDLPDDLAMAYAEAVSAASRVSAMEPDISDLQTNAILALFEIYSGYNENSGGEIE